MILDYNIQRICNKAETIPERKEDRKGEYTFACVSGSVLGCMPAAWYERRKI